MRVALVCSTVQSQLLSVAHRVTKPEGAVLFRRNEPSFGIFLICKGSVSLVLEGDWGWPIWQRTATQHSIIGLPATLSGHPYSLTARALEETELAFVERSALIELIKRDSSVGLELTQALGEEIGKMRSVLIARHQINEETTVKRSDARSHPQRTDQ